MTPTLLLTWFNLLPIWRRRQRVWGSLLEATTFDRCLYLSLHRSGWMGRDDKAFFEGIVRPGMHVVDVGANVGLYTVLFSRLVGESGKVTAIEPDPVLFEALKTTCRLNSLTNVKPYNVAAGATSGAGVFSQSLLHSGDGRMGQWPASDLRRSVDVRVATIDEIAAGGRVDFIKIDVQGWEGEVIKGMHQVLTSNPAVQICFEYWPSGLRAAGFDPKALLAALENYGFQIWPASRPRSGPITKFSELSGPSGKGYTNLYAVREAARVNPSS
jgi:FkbM family methyltransferase